MSVETRICREYGFKYEVRRKRGLKNINLRVRPDSSVFVSASYSVPISEIERLVLKHGARIAEIIKSLPPVSEEEKREYSKEEKDAFLSLAERVCRSLEPMFFSGDYTPPKIELCRGKSRWGYCMPKRNVIRLNIRLSEYPEACLRYVALHEYCHFIVPGHSAAFYSELSARLPMWKEYEKMLRESKK